jgi:hypothetical protein
MESRYGTIEKLFSDGLGIDGGRRQTSANVVQVAE